MTEAASLTDMRNTAPARQIPHRVNIVAADNGVPAATLFAANTGWWPRCRVYCTFAPTGGSNPTVALRVWVKKHLFADEAGVERIGVLMVGDATPAALTVTGGTNFVFDVPANGDDIFVEVTGVGGAPSSYVFNCALGWRA